jgi:hypothetical protein
LITNREVLEINQKASSSAPFKDLPAGFEGVRVWKATEEATSKPAEFFALFNLSEKPLTLHFDWKQLGATGAEAHDLWNGNTANAATPVSLTLPAHGSAIYRVQ